jgi:hypothetical protein
MLGLSMAYYWTVQLWVTLISCTGPNIQPGYNEWLKTLGELHWIHTGPPNPSRV